jgi:hypothetical protein
MAFQESNESAGFHDADNEAAMATTDDTLDTLSEMDHFVRLMAVASGPAKVVAAAGAYLSGWPRSRVRRLQETDAGWAPFDDRQQPFAVSSVSDVRKIAGSLRIRCRELSASDMKISPELLELDLFFFFAEESLAVFEPARSRAPGWIVSGHQSSLSLVN